MSNKFDVIIDGSCFHCIIDDDRKLFLSTIYRILKLGGFCQFRTICGEMTDSNLKEYYNKKTNNVINLAKDNFQYFHQGMPNEIIHEVENAGFKILDSDFYKRDEEGDCDFLIINTVKR